VCVLIFFAVVGDRTVRIRTVCTARERGHEFRGIGGTNFKAVLRVFLAAAKPYRSGHTTDCGHVFQGTVFWVGCTAVRT
jgi:hypothetical protein